jgi:hypothetical protein
MSEDADLKDNAVVIEVKAKDKDTGKYIMTVGTETQLFLLQR